MSLLKKRPQWSLILGIRKVSIFFSIFLAASPLVFAEVPPSPQGYVLDQAEILSQETEAALEAQLTALEAENSVQMVVVTVSSLNDYPIETYALELGRAWGVGQEEFNNGVIFLIVPEDHEARIEVGYGLEGAITDAQSFLILDQVVLPYFTQGNYDQGVLEAVTILDKLARGEPFDVESLKSASPPLWIFVFIFLPFTWGLISWFSNTKSWWIGGIFGGVLGWLIAGGLLAFALGAAAGLLMDYVLSTYLYGKIKSSSIYRGGFWGGRGGGFGGFGGGSFGGGGATGRW